MWWPEAARLLYGYVKEGAGLVVLFIGAILLAVLFMGSSLLALFIGGHFAGTVYGGTHLTLFMGCFAFNIVYWGTLLAVLFMGCSLLARIL